MASQQVTLLPVDVANVTILVDNSLDILLPSDEVAQRAPMHYDWSDREQLIAEHGYSLLLTVVREGRSESVLYDAGLGRRTVLHNMDVLAINAPDLRAAVPSRVLWLPSRTQLPSSPGAGSTIPRRRLSCCFRCRHRWLLR